MTSAVLSRLGGIPHPTGDAALRKCAAEFEGILLAQILEKLRDCYRFPGGNESDPAGDSLQSIANTALANGLGKSGGIGITEVLMRSLQRTSNVTGVE